MQKPETYLWRFRRSICSGSVLADIFRPVWYQIWFIWKSYKTFFLISQRAALVTRTLLAYNNNSLVFSKNKSALKVLLDMKICVYISCQLWFSWIIQERMVIGQSWGWRKSFGWGQPWHLSYLFQIFFLKLTFSRRVPCWGCWGRSFRPRMSHHPTWLGATPGGVIVFQYCELLCFVCWLINVIKYFHHL